MYFSETSTSYLPEHGVDTSYVNLIVSEAPESCLLQHRIPNDFRLKTTASGIMVRMHVLVITKILSSYVRGNLKGVPYSQYQVCLALVLYSLTIMK